MLSTFSGRVSFPHEATAVDLITGCLARSHTTEQINGAAIKIHRRLVPGLLESAYEACLVYELEQLGLHVQRQRAVPLIYESVKPECGLADLVVNREVVVEIKCKDMIHPVDQAQLLSCLRLLNLRVGLLLNFHEVSLKDGIRRMVNNYQDYSPIEGSSRLHEVTAETAEKTR